MRLGLGLRLGGIALFALGSVACGSGGGGGGYFDGGAGSGGVGATGGNPFGGSSGSGGSSGVGGSGGTQCQPALEVCDGKDNDCNGVVDENDPSLNEPCSTGAPGACGNGSKKCEGGQLSCVADGNGMAEQCDGIDNDCDGSVDEDVAGTGDPCTAAGVGECAKGSYECKQVGAQYQVTCVATKTASPEVCDLLDNDCDGQADDGNPGGGNSCSTGLPGACSTGQTQCTNGTLACAPLVSGTAEICNGIDDNCDGLADENNPGGGAPCGCNGVMQCQNGTLSCVGGGTTTTYFSDDFASNSKGWTLGTYWAIGPTVSSTAGSSCGGDPALDHTTSSDNGVAGVVLGGSYPTTITGPNYLTSPVIDTSTASTLYLEFWRWLNSDYPSYAINTVQVYNGSSWITVWTGASGTWIKDTTWTKQSINISSYKSSQMRVRFGFQIGSGAVACGGWNVDDVVVTSGACL